MAGLALALLLLFVVFATMRSLANMVSRFEAEDKKTVERDLGRPFFSEEKLAPFRNAKYTGTQPLAELTGSIGVLVESLEHTNRENLLNFLELQASWDEAYANPARFSGILMPLYPKSVTQAEPGPGESQWLEVETSEGPTMRVLTLRVASERLAKGGPFYLDCFYLGRALAGGKEVQLGLAREIYELPGQGIYPQMESDEVAYSDIMEELAFAQEAREVSRMAYFHVLAKIQNGEALKLAPLRNVGQRELMENPERYRGQRVSFTGSLMFIKRRRLSGAEIQPGMEYFYEGLLLNSDRVEYAFRSLRIPSTLKYRDLVSMSGLFLQRYNFTNVQGRATWLPLVIADNLEIVKEPKIGFTPLQQTVIFGGILLVLSGLAIAVIRSYRRSQASLANRRLPHPSKLKPLMTLGQNAEQRKTGHLRQTGEKTPVKLSPPLAVEPLQHTPSPAPSSPVQETLPSPQGPQASAPPTPPSVGESQVPPTGNVSPPPVLPPAT